MTQNFMGWEVKSPQTLFKYYFPYNCQHIYIGERSYLKPFKNCKHVSKLLSISPGLASFSFSDFCQLHILSDCSLQSLGNSDVAPKENTKYNLFTAIHFETGLVAKRMVFLVLKDNWETHLAELDSFPEPMLNGPNRKNVHFSRVSLPAFAYVTPQTFRVEKKEKILGQDQSAQSPDIFKKYSNFFRW